MTKKDYEAIASALRKAKKYPQQHMLMEDVIYQLSILFEKDNPRFNRDRFINACNKED